jgi:hypothetical protein
MLKSKNRLVITALAIMLALTVTTVIFTQNDTNADVLAATQTKRVAAKEISLSSNTEAAEQTLALTDAEAAEQAEAWAAADAEHEAAVENAAEYAYMDIETAPEYLHDTILEARSIIIYSQSWVADGYTMYTTSADGTVEDLPHFSELFPDWDMPVLEPSETEEIYDTALDASVQTTDTTDAVSLSYNVYLSAPPANTNSSPFTTRDGFGNITTTVSSLTSSEHCNIGYTDTSTGESLGWVPERYINYSVTLPTMIPALSSSIGVRASTYSTPGYSVLTVTSPNSASLR